MPLCSNTSSSVSAAIDAFHAELGTKKYKYLRPRIETTFYDAKCVEVIDPFGNRIRFNESLKLPDAT